jgi:hypothetical protein
MREMRLARYLVILLVASAILAGCSGAGSPAETPGTGAAGSAGSGFLKTDYENALPANMQLALGLFKLDDTSAPLTTEQAAALAPLWKAYRSLTANEGSSREIAALILQIEGTLSENQLQEISAMQLTMEDLVELAREKALILGGGGPNLSAEERATRQAQRFSGQGGGAGGEFRPGGGMGPPGGISPGGGILPGGELPPGAMATPGARQTAIAQRPAGFDVQVSPALVEALIDFLETKAQ